MLYSNADAYISNEVNMAKNKIEQVLLDNNVRLRSAVQIGRILKNLEIHLRNNIPYTVKEDCQAVEDSENT